MNPSSAFHIARLPNLAKTNCNNERVRFTDCLFSNGRPHAPTTSPYLKSVDLHNVCRNVNNLVQIDIHRWCSTMHNYHLNKHQAQQRRVIHQWSVPNWPPKRTTTMAMSHAPQHCIWYSEIVKLKLRVFPTWTAYRSGALLGRVCRSCTPQCSNVGNIENTCVGFRILVIA